MGTWGFEQRDRGRGNPNSALRSIEVTTQGEGKEEDATPSKSGRVTCVKYTVDVH